MKKQSSDSLDFLDGMLNDAAAKKPVKRKAASTLPPGAAGPSGPNISSTSHQNFGPSGPNISAGPSGPNITAKKKKR
ncbi:MAG: hypothetical protein IJJ33_14740 [Victivallales bacterium]|nr:hypothetical protein [Victivallales bacterium]